MPPPKYIQAVCMRLLSPNGTAAEREGRILAEIVIGGGVAHLDRATLNGVGCLQARYDLAWGEDLDLEAVIARLADRLGESFRRAVDGIERLWKARGEPPFEFGHGLRNSRLGDRACRRGEARRLQELSTFHLAFLPDLVGRRRSA